MQNQESEQCEGDFIDDDLNFVEQPQGVNRRESQVPSVIFSTWSSPPTSVGVISDITPGSGVGSRSSSLLNPNHGRGLCRLALEPDDNPPLYELQPHYSGSPSSSSWASPPPQNNLCTLDYVDNTPNDPKSSWVWKHFRHWLPIYIKTNRQENFPPFV